MQRARNWPTFLPFLTFAVSIGCTGLTRPPASLARNPNGTYSSAATVGSPDWWKRNRSRAEFVVGKGYRVPGVDRFFDDMGRPIDQAVAPVSHVEPEDESLLGSIAPQVTLASLKTAVGRGPDAEAARAMLADGQKLFAAKKYAMAADQFQRAADRAPDSEIEQEAVFLAAESLFFADNYVDANDAYEALLKKYPGTSYLDRVVGRQWLIAQYWQQRAAKNPDWPTTPNLTDTTRPGFDTLGRALKVYDNIRMNDPTGPLADDALMATATSHFIRGRFEEADYHFELLRRDYPKSEHQFKAHILGLQSKLRIYQGPEYDGTSLDEAEKLVKQLRLQFGATLSSEQRARVDEIAAQIAKQRAHRDWRMAEYYDNQKRFGAAKFYYARIVKQFPYTTLATESADRLAEIADEPNAPTERLSWFVDLFPESRERRRIANVPVVDSSTTRQ